MTQHYVIEAETAARDEDVADSWIDALAPWHGVVRAGPTGNLVAVITLPADDLRQATATGLGILAQAIDDEVLAVTVQPEAMRDERAGWAPVPELVSVAEAAEQLGVSRQRVLQLIDAGRLPTVRVGKVHAVLASALTSSSD
ncbi:helix-turn-helix domain-containing protein [Phycicoccus jejuensis]|uniref:helix-turn-helix domain-containing protein n=1 Tax=Phycicoccus jejuensis TaxID=367299 RepID=UPI0004C46437|nr:helix-turn-helix domain-containing protein [Phycicoccus jejuensis]